MKVIYIIDYLDDNHVQYSKHKELYTKCYEHQRVELGLVMSEPTEADIDAMEREFMRQYNEEVENR